MDDAELVQQAAAGDKDAFSVIYQRYAGRLHDFLLWVLWDKDVATAVLRETFVEAGSRLHQLREPEKLRPWLYAIAGRRALHRHHRHRAGAASGGDAEGDLGSAPSREPNELLDLVRATAAELSPRERAVLDLTLRQGLKGQDLAEALGISRGYASALLKEVEDRVERSLAARVVARFGRRDCPALASLVSDPEGHLDAGARAKVARHVDDCQTCRKHRHQITVGALLAVAPPLALPDELGDEVLADVELATRPRRPWSARRNGFPPPSVTEPERRWRIVAAAAFVVLLAAGGFLVTRGGRLSEEVASLGVTTTVPRGGSSSTSTTRPPGSSTTAPGAGPEMGSPVPPPSGPGSSSSAAGGPGGIGGSGTGADEPGAPAGSTDAEPEPPGTDGGGTGVRAPDDTVDPAPPDPAVPDTEGPAISGLSVSPSVLRAGNGCANPDPLQAGVSVRVTDPSGVDWVTVTVVGPGGSPVGMSSVGGGTYVATVGPFQSPLPAGNDFPAQAVVQATDRGGHSSAATAPVTLRCEAVPG